MAFGLSHIEGIDDLKKNSFGGQVGGYLVGVGPRENETKGSEDSDFQFFFYKRKVRNRGVAERESVFTSNVNVGQIRAYL